MQVLIFYIDKWPLTPSWKSITIVQQKMGTLNQSFGPLWMRKHLCAEWSFRLRFTSYICNTVGNYVDPKSLTEMFASETVLQSDTLELGFVPYFEASTFCQFLRFSSRKNVGICPLGAGFIAAFRPGSLCTIFAVLTQFLVDSYICLPEITPLISRVSTD